ncbi:hypothetical protein CRUP_014998 [Coryphaenoides rupestris]|nr:hypothetical protein CRUP_014998 [Coryphaenoides rupestris]
MVVTCGGGLQAPRGTGVGAEEGGYGGGNRGGCGGQVREGDRKWERRGWWCPPGVHLFLGGWAVRGGVTGRPELTPPYWYLAFFSEGFRICEIKTTRRGVKKTHRPPCLAVAPGYLVGSADEVQVVAVEELADHIRAEGQQQADGLQGLLAPVHVVAQEQVVGLWREAAVLKEPQQVRVLAVDVTCGEDERERKC